ncbi:kinase-like domain-containing protein [Polychytrium aggregatum]|uniref:kinase-like domain-containing protein n=1 Tax=Polychytrium aggregatum TaxID=110093 RepID=UPI0022FEFEE7|nr:kinase-like domain-containing protein [Polychytrium aggregatum]KAI9187546.1 kinase-like domain-containing protein [Polychytrium aggregatum]
MVVVKDYTVHINQRLGKGSYGTVYRGSKNGKTYALKKTTMEKPGELSATLIREIAILKRLAGHPNIVQLEEFFFADNLKFTWLVFEEYKTTLDALIKSKDDGLSMDETFKFSSNLIDGLVYMEEQGCIHRDLKPGNILVHADGHCVIADFGLARMDRTLYNVKQDTSVVTLWYRAPEILLGCIDYTLQADMWSLGCIVFEMFFGQPLISTKTGHEQLSVILTIIGSVPLKTYSLKIPTKTSDPNSAAWYMHLEGKPNGMYHHLRNVFVKEEQRHWVCKMLELDPAQRARPRESKDELLALMRAQLL